MTYLFKSKAAGDVIMLEPAGDRLLRLMGKEPATEGIIEPGVMAAAIRAIEVALAQEDVLLAQARKSAAQEHPADSSDDGVTLRQRAWPLLEMLRSAHAGAQAIVWGV